MTGAPEGFEEFVGNRAASLLRYGYVLTGNTHDAADLVQEALVRLGVAWSRVRRQEDPVGYVRTTMARLHISWWRGRRREVLVREVPDEWHSDDVSAVERHGALWHALLRLPARRRAVLILRYYEVCTDEEIAAILGISRGTVRSLAARGLEQLRQTWESFHGSTVALTKEPR